MLTLLDLSAAFDSVDQITLLRQLRTSYCLSGKVIDWLTSYLSDRKQQVRTTTSSSMQSAVLFGVPRGSVLGPILTVQCSVVLPSCRRRFSTPSPTACICGLNDLTDVCRTSVRRHKTDGGFRQIRDGRTGPIDVRVLAGTDL